MSGKTITILDGLSSFEIWSIELPLVYNQWSYFTNKSRFKKRSHATIKRSGDKMHVSYINHKSIINKEEFFSIWIDEIFLLSIQNKIVIPFHMIDESQGHSILSKTNKRKLGSIKSCNLILIVQQAN